MLAIRMQRTGRKGHAQFRLIVQDKRFSPKNGRVVAFLGSYDPHTKKAILDTEKATAYLKNGAQPTDRVASILKSEGVKLPSWVNLSQPQKRTVKNPEKLRRNRPAGAEEVPAGVEDSAQNTEEAQPSETTAEEPANAEDSAKEPSAKEPEKTANAKAPAEENPAQDTPAEDSAKTAE